MKTCGRKSIHIYRISRNIGRIWEMMQCVFHRRRRERLTFRPRRWRPRDRAVYTSLARRTFLIPGARFTYSLIPALSYRINVPLRVRAAVEISLDELATSTVNPVARPSITPFGASRRAAVGIGSITAYLYLYAWKSTWPTFELSAVYIAASAAGWPMID